MGPDQRWATAHERAVQQRARRREARTLPRVLELFAVGKRPRLLLLKLRLDGTLLHVLLQLAERGREFVARPGAVPLVSWQLAQHRDELLLAHREQLVDVLQHAATLIDGHDDDVEFVVYAPLDGAGVILVDVDSAALLAQARQASPEPTSRERGSEREREGEGVRAREQQLDCTPASQSTGELTRRSGAMLCSASPPSARFGSGCPPDCPSWVPTTASRAIRRSCGERGSDRASCATVERAGSRRQTSLFVLVCSCCLVKDREGEVCLWS